jgi:hypothetical protein
MFLVVCVSSLGISLHSPTFFLAVLCACFALGSFQKKKKRRRKNCTVGILFPELLSCSFCFSFFFFFCASLQKRAHVVTGKKHAFCTTADKRGKTVKEEKKVIEEGAKWLGV